MLHDLLRKHGICPCGSWCTHTHHLKQLQGKFFMEADTWNNSAPHCKHRNMRDENMMLCSLKRITCQWSTVGSKEDKAALSVVYMLCCVTGSYCVTAQLPFYPCDRNESWHHSNTILPRVPGSPSKVNNTGITQRQLYRDKGCLGRKDAEKHKRGHRGQILMTSMRGY